MTLIAPPRGIALPRRRLISRRSLIRAVLAAPAILKLGLGEAEAGFCGKLSVGSVIKPPPEALANNFTTLLASMSNEFTDPTTIDTTGNAAAGSNINLFNSGGFAGSPGQFSIANSLLTISTSGDSNVGMLSGINNANKGTSCQYFTVEWLIRFTPQCNNHPVVWTFCAEHNEGTDGGQGAEFDVAEFGGGAFFGGACGSQTYINNFHLTSAGAPSVASNFPSTVGFNSTDFHRYSFVWVPGTGTMYRDGVATFSYNYAGNQPFWDGSTMHEFITMGFDAAWNGTNPAAATMDIDFVRTWINPFVSHVRNNF